MFNSLPAACHDGLVRSQIIGRFATSAFAATFGEMVMISLSGEVLPKRLLNTGFDFKYTDVEQALKDIT
jgi:NAD dependent epimerase/dehydratase family enzyme